MNVKHPVVLPEFSFETKVSILKDKLRLYLKIFFYTFQLSATTFGGGYVIVSMVQRLFVEKLGWISREEMLDYTAMAQTAPGSIAVNISVLIGRRLAGWPGIFLSVLGTVLPPLILLSLLSVCYTAVIGSRAVQFLLRGMEAAIIALILNAVVNLGLPYIKSRNILALTLMTAACLLSFVWEVSVVYIIIGSGLLGVILALITKRKKSRKAGQDDLS